MNNTRELVYICERCFHKLPGALTMTYPKMRDLNLHFDSTGVSHLLGTCPKCKERTFFFTVDKYMGKVISILNQAGYYTDFCCQGHSYTQFEKNDDGTYHIAYRYDRSYISFKRSESCKPEILHDCLVEAGFDEFSMCTGEVGMIEYKNCVPKKRWKLKDPFAVYLDEEFIIANYKTIAMKYQNRKVDNKILDAIDTQIDKVFAKQCSELASLLTKNKKLL